MKNLSALIIGAMLISSIALSAYATTCPYDSDYKFVLKKALTDYYANPQESKLSPSELSSLLNFYLSSETITNGDCDQANIAQLLVKADATIPDATLLNINTISASACDACPDGAVCGEENDHGQTCTCKDVNNDGKSEYCYLKPIVPPKPHCIICPDGTLCGEQNNKDETCLCTDVNNDQEYEYCRLKPINEPTTTTIPVPKCLQWGQNKCDGQIRCCEGYQCMGDLKIPEQSTCCKQGECSIGGRCTTDCPQKCRPYGSHGCDGQVKCCQSWQCKGDLKIPEETTCCDQGQCAVNGDCTTNCPTCDLNTVKNYTCPDQTQVPWCKCELSSAGTAPTWICINSPETQCKCTGEGQYTPTPDNVNCCQGLTPRDCTAPNDNGICVKTPCNGRQCTNCGNGICGVGENICNCPQDCPQKCLPYGSHGCDGQVKCCQSWQCKGDLKVPGETTCCDQGQCAVNGDCTTNCPTCDLNSVKYYTCPDQTQVPWCKCGSSSAGTAPTWICINSPETQCKPVVTCDVDANCVDDGTTCHVCVNQDWLRQNPDWTKTHPCAGIGTSICKCVDRICKSVAVCGDGTCDTTYENANNCPKDCTQPCLEEGMGAGGSDPSQLPACCQGLSHTPIIVNMTTCTKAPDNGFICTKCGNGICGAGENQCNCPQDCPENCKPGEIKTYTCPDQTQVPWCTCTEKGTWNCINSPETQCKCVEEGGSYTIVPGTAPKCCQGLTGIGCDRPDGNGNCPTPGTCTGATFCTKCGDGQCGPGENKCNCPDDCEQCKPGTIKNYVCDQTQPNLVVPWCTCNAKGTWTCINSPETQCKPNKDCKLDTDCVDDGTTCHLCVNQDWLRQNPDWTKTHACAGIGTSICKCVDNVCTSRSVCGDGKCDQTYENAKNCPQDCPVCLTGWKYKMPVTIKSATALSVPDYSVSLVVNTKDLIGAGKMKADCSDMRFTDSDMLTVLPYWLQSGCNTVATTVWVKVPFLPAGSKIIYMYYGNQGAASKSDRSSTFIGYWSFDSGTEGWSGGTNGQSYSTATFDSSAGNPPGDLHLDGCYGDPSSWWTKTIALPVGPNIDVWFMTSADGGDGEMRFKVGSKVYYDECLGGTSWRSKGPYDISAYAGQTVTLKFEEKTCGVFCQGEHRFVDNVIIRRYVTPEPEASAGAEQNC